MAIFNFHSSTGFGAQSGTKRQSLGDFLVSRVERKSVNKQKTHNRKLIVHPRLIRQRAWIEVSCIKSHWKAAIRNLGGKLASTESVEWERYDLQFRNYYQLSLLDSEIRIPRRWYTLAAPSGHSGTLKMEWSHVPFSVAIYSVVFFLIEIILSLFFCLSLI